jgi:simple sugar transport system permease protein
VIAGAALAGVGGASISLAYARTWASTMPNGLGWIAIALVPLSGWRPVRAAGLSLVLGVAMALQMRFQILGLRLAPSLLEMLRYLVALAVLVLGKVGGRGRSAGAEPSALGRPEV